MYQFKTGIVKLAKSSKIAFSVLFISVFLGMLIITNTVIHIHIPALVTPALPFDSGVYLLKLIVDGFDPIIDPFLKGRITVANGI